MTTNPTPYALGSEDGEAFWFFRMLATMKATAEQTGGEFILVEQLAPLRDAGSVNRLRAYRDPSVGIAPEGDGVLREGRREQHLNDV